MNWTHDAPTKPGAYWFREKPGKKRNEIIRVFKFRKGHGPLYAYVPFLGFTYQVADVARWYPKAEWSSTPIPEPKEPQ